MPYDVVIIGAGPAGSTLARMLNKSFKVLIVDKREFKGKSSSAKTKCCGGLLAPDAQKVLAQFGLALPGEVIVEPQMFSVKCVDLDNRLTRYYQRHYININRELFDRLLLSLVDDNVVIKTKALFKDYRQCEDYIEVDLYCNGKTEKVKTRLLIGADGATSKVRRGITDSQPDVYVSIQKWYKSKQKIPHFISVFDENVTDFYSWVIQKRDCTVVGTALKDTKNCEEKFNLLIDSLKSNGYNFGQCVRTEGAWIMRPRQLKQLNLGQGNIALVGEAAGFISPSSAEGISYALKSGAALAKSINQSVDSYQKLYKKNAAQLKLNILAKNLKLKFMYNKYTRKTIMKSGVLSMKLEQDICCKPEAQCLLK